MTNLVIDLEALVQNATISEFSEFSDQPWHWGKADIVAFDDKSLSKINGRGYRNIFENATIEDARLVAYILNNIPDIIKELRKADKAKGVIKSLMEAASANQIEDNIIASVFPDIKSRNGDNIGDNVKLARRAMNEARAFMSLTNS